MQLNEAQRQYLLSPLHKSRVGKDGKGFAHVEAWDIRRVMNGTFGFTGWSADTISMECIFEQHGSDDGKKNGWFVAYRAQVRVMVGDATYTEWAGGDASNYPSRADAHDQAMKTAESQAFKRACVNLGDQFGLCLYDKGGLKQSLKATLDVPVNKADSAGKAAEFAADLEIEGGGTEDVPNGTPDGPALEPMPDGPPTQPPADDPDAAEWVARMKDCVAAGDIAGIVAIKGQMGDAANLVFQGVTLAKWADKGVVSAGKNAGLASGEVTE